MDPLETTHSSQGSVENHSSQDVSAEDPNTENTTTDETSSSANKEFKYICPRCGHGTHLKANMTSHLGNKKECKVKFQNISREAILATLKNPPPKLPQMECPKCKKVVAKANISRHTKTCKEKPQATTNTSNQQPIQLDPLQIERYINERVEAALKEKLQGNTTIYNTINNNTFNITVNPYGNETTTHLTSEFLSHCIMNPRRGITELIENIHYNDNVPENKNVRFKSNKKNTFEKFRDNMWIECDASNTLDELIRKGYRILNNHYTNTFLTDPQFVEDELRMSVVERFRLLDDPTCQFYFSAKRDVRLLIKNKTLYVVAQPNEEGLIEGPSQEEVDNDE